MKNIVRQIACIMVSFAIAVAYAPLGPVWAVDGASEQDTAEEAQAASSVIVEENENTAPGEEETGSTDEAVTETETTESEETDTDEKNNSQATVHFLSKKALKSAAGDVGISAGVENGTLSIDSTGSVIKGTAEPIEGYDLATVRQLWKDEDGTSRERYLEYTESNGIYTFEAEKIKGSEITAFFYSLSRWDGAVDLTWYDPDQTEFEIGTPAELAGLAAIANGMVDDNITAEYMIKDNGGRYVSGSGYAHKYISTEPWQVDLLTPNSGGSGNDAIQVRDTAWRLPEVDHKKAGGASDDVHNDFLYRTVRLTADLDMSGANWTPIGGKYAMNRDADTGKDARVIDTRFQGVFDGQGHTVTLECNRQAKLGFPYAMEIALIGYLGGGVDYKNGYPKDTCMDYENYWVPTARNVVVRGTVKGRRMVGGVVGRTGETNYGVLVENCANYARIEATDMRGCAGIVGAAWGKATIRNCYNAGTIISAFWEHGGIVGSNGYEGSGTRSPQGADIYNCYNVGETLLNIGGNQTRYDGQEIGADGNAYASYEIANCYYTKPEKELEGQTGYYSGTSKNIRIRNTEAMEPADMKTGEFADRLNMNGEIFVSDENNINDGYPILWYQSDTQHSGSAGITLDKNGSANGNISFENSSGDYLGGLAYGSIINLSAKANAGYRLAKYVVSAAGGVEFEMSSGNFVALTGQDITVKAVFEEVSKTEVLFNEPGDEGKLYYVVVNKVGRYDGEKNVDISPQPVKSGDFLDYKDRIQISGVMNPWGNKEPDDNNTEYTGEVNKEPYEDVSLKKVPGTNNIYEITGEKDSVTIRFKPKTQGKRWTTLADTSWYKEGTKRFVITTTRQLAGVAKLTQNGKDFKGVTIELGNNISLANTSANGGNGYEISWIGIGTARTPFRGVFDGKGYAVRNINRNFANGFSEISGGALGGLFGVTDGAVIKNVSVSSDAYTNDAGARMTCGFVNGATGGGIVGTAINTLVENCSTEIKMDGDVSGTIGGIAGEIEGNTTIRNCISDCIIDSKGESAGGIAAVLRDSGNILIERCVNNGTVTSTKWKVGGILGSGESYAATVSECINKGSISTNMKGTSSAAHAAGGIVGYAAGPLTISKCINKGPLSGYGQTYAMGGIAGTLIRGTITDSANIGDIYSDSASEWAEVSGIANTGTNRNLIATIKNSYNAGKITLGSNFSQEARKNVGGVTGYGNATTNIFSNAVCTDRSVAAAGGTAGVAGEVVSEDALKTNPASIIGDSFAPDRNNINGGMPVLAWQDPSAVAEVRSVSAAKSGKNAVKVRWSASGPRDGFELQQSINSKAYETVYTGAELSHKCLKLKAGNKYAYRVRAYRNESSGKYYGEWVNSKAVSILLPAMKLSTVKNKKGKKAEIKWKKVKGAKGYEIYRATSKKGKYSRVKTVKVSKKLAKKKTLLYTNGKLKKKKKYYYKIRYYKLTGKKKVYSDLSAAKAVKIKK